MTSGSVDSSPTWKDLIDMISDMVKGVDENAKRESDKLHDDIAALRVEICSFRKELTDNRSDTNLNRNEMANLRTDMATFKGELKEQMNAADAAQCQEIELIKLSGEITTGTKAKIVAFIISILSAISLVVLKVFNYI